jgi:iron-sulfur cluster insertion protein
MFMDNVGIYTPPQPAKPAASGGSNVFEPSLTISDLEVTQSAQDKLQEIVTQTEEDVSAIRIYISGGGCGGMSYGMTFTDEQSDFDTTLQFDGFKNYLKGAQIDYVQEVGRERFVFNNVFAETGGSGVCGGCGAAGGGGHG